jgi:DNA invertase Pin-like site-specific DNA recombinase
MKQIIERQVKKIKELYPESIIISETYTGGTTDRPAWNKLYKNLKTGDTVVFDEVSRMSRNADEGFKIYKELYEKGVNLVFIREPHINTDSYKQAMQGVVNMDIQSGDKAMDELVNGILAAINRYMLNKVELDIQTAFKQAEQELQFLHQRTAEGMQVAKLNGKQIGRVQGVKVETKKAKANKDIILKLSKTFNGHNSDVEVMKITGLARNTYYKYKAELKADIDGGQIVGQNNIYKYLDK